MDGLAGTAVLVRSAGARAQAIVADVADLSAVARAAGDTVDRFGRLDAAHNNAGVAGPSCRWTGTRPRSSCGSCRWT